MIDGPWALGPPWVPTRVGLGVVSACARVCPCFLSSYSQSYSAQCKLNSKLPSIDESNRSAVHASMRRHFSYAVHTSSIN